MTIKKFAVDHVPRLLRTIWLLWQIWNHAHWSVALAMTCMFIFAEFSGWVLVFVLKEILEKYQIAIERAKEQQ